MEQNNKLIAEFMEVKFYPHKLIAECRGVEFDKGTFYNMGYDIFSDGNLYRSHELKYHESWDWLREVVLKIEQDCGGVPQEMLNISLYSDINEVYKAVIEFIKNQND